MVANAAKAESKSATIVATEAHDATKKLGAAVKDAAEPATKADTAPTKNRQNILRLAKSNLAFEQRLRTVKRKQVLG